MQFTAQVWGLPTSVHIPRSSGIDPHRFLVYADRDAWAFTVDSLDDTQRWRFTKSMATHSRGRIIEELGLEARRLAGAVLSGVFDEFGDCPGLEVGDPGDFGLHGVYKVARTTWKSVECAWLPVDHVPTVFLGYTHYPPEPPQLTRVRFALDGAQVEIELSRIVYDQPIPDAAASSVVQAPPEKYYVAPLRPGATPSEKMEHMQRTQHIERMGPEERDGTAPP